MPASLEEPTSGPAPHPGPDEPSPPKVVPRRVTVKSSATVATVVPFSGAAAVPPSLLAYLSDQLNREIETGGTFPMAEPVSLADFGPYWFGNFGAVMLLGEARGEDDGRDWAKECLGTFYVKPQYPGRSSHICTGAFIVTDRSRDRDVRKQMGQAYLEWAPMLGYTYSVFDLVYETDVASCRLWDELGFQRIGRIPAAGKLRSHPVGLVDAIIYGRELGAKSTDGDDSTIGHPAAHVAYPHAGPSQQPPPFHILLQQTVGSQQTVAPAMPPPQVSSHTAAQPQAGTMPHHVSQGLFDPTDPLVDIYGGLESDGVLVDPSFMEGLQYHMPSSQAPNKQDGQDGLPHHVSHPDHQPQPQEQQEPHLHPQGVSHGEQLTSTLTEPHVDYQALLDSDHLYGEMLLSHQPTGQARAYGASLSAPARRRPAHISPVGHTFPAQVPPGSLSQSPLNYGFGSPLPLGQPLYSPVDSGFPAEVPPSSLQQPPLDLDVVQDQPLFSPVDHGFLARAPSGLLQASSLGPQPPQGQPRYSPVDQVFPAQPLSGLMQQSPLGYSLDSPLPQSQPLYSPVDHGFPAQAPPSSLQQSSLGLPIVHDLPFRAPVDHGFSAQAPSGSLQQSSLGHQPPQGQAQYSPADHGFPAHAPSGSLQQSSLGLPVVHDLPFRAAVDHGFSAQAPSGSLQHSSLGLPVVHDLPFRAPVDHGFSAQAPSGSLQQSSLGLPVVHDLPFRAPVDHGLSAQAPSGSLQQSSLGHQPSQGQAQYSPADHGSPAQVPQGSARYTSFSSGSLSRLPQGSSHPSTRVPGPPRLGGSMIGDEVYHLQQEATLPQKRRAAAARIRSLRKLGRQGNAVGPLTHATRTQAARQQLVPDALVEPPSDMDQPMADIAANIPLDSRGGVGPRAEPRTGTASVRLGLTVPIPTTTTTISPAMLTATTAVSPASPIPDTPRPLAGHDDKASDQRTTPRRKEG